MEQSTEKDEKEKIGLVIVIVLLLILIFLALFLLQGNKKAIGKTVKMLDTKNNSKPTEYVTYPGYTDNFIINKEKQTFPVYNLKSNSYNVRYVLSYESSILYDTVDYLEPGTGIDINIYSILDSGIYECTLQALTKDKNGNDGYSIEFKPVINLQK